jgi:hypothetical protein
VTEVWTDALRFKVIPSSSKVNPLRLISTVEIRSKERKTFRVWLSDRDEIVKEFGRMNFRVTIAKKVICEKYKGTQGHIYAS